jgi:ABC-type multidrug transport system fused ATPase/permease subunit
LLNALLGELPFINEGSINVQGSVFYVPQEPWIFSASIRQNIIFGKPYDPKKFMSIVKACCLDEVTTTKFKSI